jgi:hypothetical protein
VTVLYQFYNRGSSVYGINNIKFADGTVWDRTTIAANAPIRGTAGNDYINLPSDGVTVDAGAGDDIFAVSGNGSDRILFAKGDGHDTLTNPGSGYNRNDTLVLTDLNASDVQFSRNGVGLVLTVPSTGDSFTASFQFWGDGSQIQGLTHIQFADGTIWDRSAIADSVQSFTWAGSAANATLNGNNYGSNISNSEAARRPPTEVRGITSIRLPLRPVRRRQPSFFLYLSKRTGFSGRHHRPEPLVRAIGQRSEDWSLGDGHECECGRRVCRRV